MSLFDVDSSRISIFIVNAQASLGCSGKITRMMRRTLDSITNFHNEGPSAGSDRGSKRRREGEEHESASTPSEPATRSASRSTTRTQSRQMSASESAFAEEPVHTTCQIDEPPHSVFETGAEDQPIVQTSQHPEWFSQPRKPPTPDRDWNKTLAAIQESAQTWISDLAKQADSRSSFNELLDTPIDFSNFIMNRLCVDTLTLELLAGPTFELMRGSCTSLTELEYHLEEPLPLIPDNRGRRVIPFEHFINNDLEYLRGGASLTGGGNVSSSIGVILEEKGKEHGFDSKKDEVVPKVEDMSLVDGVFDGALGGDGDEDFEIGEEPWRKKGIGEEDDEYDEEKEVDDYLIKIRWINMVRHGYSDFGFQKVFRKCKNVARAR
nr:hypothetical protein [Tanacetum cinerariifolium]